MKLIKWQSNFATGVPSVDFDHQEMISTINEALEEIHKSKRPDQIIELLGDINVGISSHFALEEKLMRWVGYGEFKAHKEDHEKLLNEIRDIMDSVENHSGAALEERLSRHLIDWFSNHFSTFDSRLHKALA